MNLNERPRFRTRALAAAVLGLWFFLIYNITNHLAAQSGVSNTWYMDWELQIPVIPWLIVPYWSIDLLFVGGFLQCTTHSELRVLSRRVFFAITCAGLMFYLFPLQLGFTRSSEHGVWSPLFQALYSFDLPYNLFPSLHVTFALLMRWTYVRHVRGIWRSVFHLWFALITISTLFVHQHHVVDVIGGAALGVLCMYVFDEDHVRSCQIVRNKRSNLLAGMYGLLAIICLVVACSFQSWYFWFLWPAFCLLCVCFGYAGIGSKIVQPRQAGPSIPARIILLPWLEILGWSRRWWWRQSFPPVEVIDGVWIGRIPDCKHFDGAVIDCTCEHRRRMPVSNIYERVPMLDLALPDAEALRHVAMRIAEMRNENANVMVVCGLGLGRSALSIVAYLLLSGQASSAKEALAMLKAHRPEARMHPEAEIELSKLLEDSQTDRTNV